MPAVDIIGDIHGYADKLRRLLGRLGYHEHGGVYSHPERRATFVGDLIDRGPAIGEVLEIVSDMVHADSAQIVMGNHEFNALAFHTPDGNIRGLGSRLNITYNILLT
jgi:Calcineurin-like phosphoesterase